MERFKRGGEFKDAESEGLLSSFLPSASNHKHTSFCETLRLLSAAC